MSYNMVIAGLPRDLQMSLNDFYNVSAVLETNSSHVFEGKLYEVLNGKVLLDDGVDTVEVALADVINIQLNAKTETSDYTLQVPVSWMNRVVYVELPHGKISGLLSDANLGASKHLYLDAMPGSPHVPPLPHDIVRGVSLAAKALHVSWQTSGDGEWRVHRYYLQDLHSIAVRELHTPTGIDAHTYEQILNDSESDIIPLLPELYQMKYTTISGSLSRQCNFYRFPRPEHGEGLTIAQTDAFRMQWLPAGRPDLGNKNQQFLVAFGERYTSDVNKENDSEVEIDGSSTGS